MKLAFIGLGSMGKSIQIIAHERDHTTVAEIGRKDIISLETLLTADLVIECTIPSACFENIKKICEAQKDCVVVTTGWYDHIDEVKKIVKASGIRFLYSSNFSIGVNVYYRIVEMAAKLINKFDEYDVWGTEIHHKNKIDSPSGTAKILEEILIRNIVRKNKIVEEKLDRKIADDEIHFSSTRGGLVNFGHMIGFDSASDVIKIEHCARNRDGYALGTIKCAEWLKAQEPGFYTMENYLESVMGHFR